MDQIKFTMTLSEVFAMLSFLSVIVIAFFKLKIDIKKLDTFTKLKFTEIEANFKAHCADNDADLKQFRREYREDQAEIKSKIDKIVDHLMK